MKFKNYSIIIFFTAAILAACADKKEEHREATLGDYFYTISDINHIAPYHIDKKCPSSNGGLHLVKVSEFLPKVYREGDGYKIRRYHEIIGKYKSHEVEFCADCISDEVMNMIDEQIEK